MGKILQYIKYYIEQLKITKFGFLPNTTLMKKYIEKNGKYIG